MANLIDFQLAPDLGTVLALDGQEYELISTRPHMRRDGLATTLLDWRSNCPTCGEEFAVTTGLVSNYVARRCAKHLKPGKPVKGRRGRKVHVVVRPA